MSSKRRFCDGEQDVKKVRQESEKPEYNSSEEWPIYNHPEGGIVKITPWGSLRQYVNPLNGQTVTKFEDMNFQDHTFHQTVDQSPVYVPSTPQSICPTSSDSPSPADGMKLSPSHEVEHYVMEGYSDKQQQQQHQQQFPQSQSQGYEYAQEHENYFGMGNSEEEMDDQATSADQMMT